MSNGSLKPAIISGTTALIVGVISVAVTWMVARQNIELANNKLKASYVIAEHNQSEKQAALLFGEIADVLSFFNQNNDFTPEEAKLQIAEARRAAFEFSAYVSPELGYKAIKAIEILNVATLPENHSNLDELLKELFNAQKDLTSSFHREKKRKESIISQTFTDKSE